MKREILVKGKGLNGIWYKGNLIESSNGECYILQKNSNPIRKGSNGYWDINSPCFQVHPDTVCQLIKDDLFVNDLVEREEANCKWETIIGKYQIVYDSDNHRYALKTIKSEIFKEGSIVGFHGQLTKIGNIHDETH